MPQVKIRKIYKWFSLLFLENKGHKLTNKYNMKGAIYNILNAIFLAKGHVKTMF